jgi:peptide/nickel transport system substrate-binding protein
MKRNLYFLLVMFIFSVLMTGCVKSTGKAGELRYGFSSEPKTLDPLDMAGNTADGRSILFNVFEGLVKPDTTGQFLPCIAESWAIEQGGLIYNFLIRDNIFFHDGAILTAADVKFSLETAISLNYIGLDIIEEVKITGDNIVTVTLKVPDPEFLPYMTVGITKNGHDNRARNAIGSGPFYIESYRSQRNMILKKFDKYWQRLLPEPNNIPYLDKVTILFYETYDTMVLALRGGSIDGANVTGSFAAQLDRGHFDIFHNYSNAVQLLALNNTSPPLNDLHIRRALNFGIDIQNIIDSAFFGMGSPSRSPIIPGLSVYYENSDIFPYDPEKAKELLGHSGYNNDNRLSLEITVSSNYTMHVDTAQVIADQLSKIGINTLIKLVDWDTWLSDVYRNHNYQATIISLDSVVASPKSFLSRYHSNSSSNFINFNNPDFDKIFDSILVESNEERRTNLYKEAQRSIIENAASVYIQDILYYKAFRKNAYGGVLNYPLYVVDFSNIYGIEKN